MSESELAGVFDLLAAEGWAAVRLPPPELDAETASAQLEDLAEYAGEVRERGDAIVLLDDGAYPDLLGAAFAGRGVGPLPRLSLPAESGDLRAFLRRNAVEPASARSAAEKT